MTMPRARYTNPMTLALHVQKEYEVTSIPILLPRDLRSYYSSMLASYRVMGYQMLSERYMPSVMCWTLSDIILSSN